MMAIGIGRKFGNMFKRRTSNASHETKSPLRTSTQSSQNSSGTTDTMPSLSILDFAQKYKQVMGGTEIGEQNPENYTLKYSEDRSEAIPLPQELRDELPRMKSLIKDLHEYAKKRKIGRAYHQKNVSETLKLMVKLGASFKEEDIAFAQNWVDRVEKFIQAKGEKLIGSPSGNA